MLIAPRLWSMWLKNCDSRCQDDYPSVLTMVKGKVTTSFGQTLGLSNKFKIKNCDIHTSYSRTPQ